MANGHYTRAIEADPKHANTLGNYAQFAFSRGHREDGLAMLRRALPRADATLLPLRVELLFYALAHSAAPMQLTVAQMKGLVGAGVRTGDWDFKSSIARAALDGTADTGFLDDLAGVLGGKAEPEILDVYPVWRDAVAAPFDPAALGFPAEA